MVAVDTNILVYASANRFEQHHEAEELVDRLAESGECWAITWPNVHEFIAVVSNPRVFQPAMEIEEAVARVERWMSSPGLRLIGEGPGHWEMLKIELRESRVRGPRVHDARIAAICREQGVREIWTADRDFGRFGVRTRNPLKSRK